jgi:hypothetical protein
VTCGKNLTVGACDCNGMKFNEVQEQNAHLHPLSLALSTAASDARALRQRQRGCALAQHQKLLACGRAFSDWGSRATSAAAWRKLVKNNEEQG